MNRLKAYYFALLRYVPRSVLAVALVSVVFLLAVAFNEWWKVNPEIAGTAAKVITLIAGIGVSASLLSLLLPADPRKRKDD